MALGDTKELWGLAVLILGIGAMVERAGGHSGTVFNNSTDFFCPCFNRKAVTFSFVTHSRESTTQMGFQLRAGVQQALRDRNLRVNEYVPVDFFELIDATTFLDAEIAANTAGIITTFYSDMLLPSLAQANKAGIPVYIVGGADPELYQDFQREEPDTGPVHASIRYIGADMAQVANTLAADLIAAGITHLECVMSDIGDLTWYKQCGRLVALFQAAGLHARHQLRAPVMFDLTQYVAEMAAEFSLVPARQIAIILPDGTVYKAIQPGLVRSLKAEVLLVVYETSVDILEDVRTGRNVLALDLNYYAQGFLGLALASVERQTGQMVTSDIMTEWTLYGQGANEVTDAVMRREVCRVARNPVCGDPGVAQVTPTGCPCFNRSEVAFKVVGLTPHLIGNVANMWQGLVDAERDLPGSTFRWDVQPEVNFEHLVADIAEVASNTSRWRGAISLDTMNLDVPLIVSALESLKGTGKPLYLGNMQSQGSPEAMPAVLGSLGARVFVGANVWSAGYMASRYAAQLGYEHTLGVNVVPYLSWAWKNMEGVATGVLGTSYQYPNGTWEWPLTAHGNASQRTGAWSLFAAAGSNHTVQVINGVFPTEYLTSMKDRLLTNSPAPDLVVVQAITPRSVLEVLAVLKEVGVAQPGRVPIGLIMQQCKIHEFQAFMRQGYVQGEELLMGCIDYQSYLSTYLLAHLAALEQHTGERVVGEVSTERLIRVTHRPSNFQTRVACETSAFNQGTSKGIFGTMYPICDVRKGCMDPNTGSSSATSPLSLTTLSQAAKVSDPECSGHGSCRFLTALPAAHMYNPNVTYSATQGACNCGGGWSGDFCSVPPPSDATGDGGNHQLFVMVITLSASLLVLVVALVISLLRRGRQQAVVEDFSRKRTPPKKNDRITAVITDIEGSTSLWEWNPSVMRQALAIHHNVLRMLLPRYHGYESDTEGDSFSLVFHDPVDALGWAMDVQRSLLFPAALIKTAVPPVCQYKKAQHYVEEGHTDWPPELLAFGAGKEERSPQDGTVLYRGLRVRMGIHIGVPDACTMHANGRLHYQGEVMEVTKAVQDSAVAGGQVLVSMPAWQSLGMHSLAVVCHDLGLHEVGERLPPVHLLEVLPQTLAKRAPFPPLKSRQLSPSFFDAPGSWYYLQGQAPKESLVIVFLYVGGAKVLRKTPFYKEAVELLTGFVQDLLPRFDGYECEEKEGNFLLAFRSADKAAQFAVTVQRDAMMLRWPCRILEEDLAAEMVTSPDYDAKSLPEADPAAAPVAEVLVFRGLRLQIGLCMGVPSDVQPHMTTGRAAYFGPIVNRAARIAATAACGQTLANHLLYQSIKESCPGLCFKEMGRFDLKGVREPMHLYQVSCPELRGRLFPRTLRVARLPVPIFTNPVAGGRSSDDEPRSPEGSTHGAFSISIGLDGSVSVRTPDVATTEATTKTHVDQFVHSSPRVVEP